MCAFMLHFFGLRTFVLWLKRRSTMFLREWNQVPDDVLALIIQGLTTPSQLICFGAVCRNWRRLKKCVVARTLPPDSYLPPRSEQPSFHLYSPFDHTLQKLHYMMKDNFNLWSVVGGDNHGWLIIETDENKLSVVNPLLNLSIEMPPLQAANGSTFTISKAAITWGLGGSGHDPTVAAIAKHPFYGDLAFARPGHRGWQVVRSVCHSLVDVIHHKGQFYAVNHVGIVATCEVRENGVSIVSPLVPWASAANKHMPTYSFMTMP